MKSIKIKLIIRNFLYFIFLFFVVACENKTSHYSIETCIINYADSKVEHINILFSGEKYSIPSLQPNEKKCFIAPLYSDASYNISLCLGDNKYQIKNIGYYWSGNIITNVDIFLENRVLVKSEPNTKLPNSEYNYTNNGKCQ